MSTRLRLLFVPLLLCCAAFSASGAPLRPEQAPEPLRPWVSWVLHGVEEAACPTLYDNGAAHRCAWPTALELDLREDGGGFTQQWQLFAEGWIVLPGDGRHWPQEVSVNGRPAAVAERGGRPGVLLPVGRHRIAGRFLWSALPESLSVPPETGIVSLTLAGRSLPFPDLDPEGRLWLKGRAGKAASAEARLEIQVFRRLVDDIPFQLLTRLELEVSGPPREVLLGRALPEGFLPLSLSGPLPARLEPDGRLRLQVRPGRWSVEVRGRHQGPLEGLTLADPGRPWASEEIWVFEARNHLRLVSPEGLTAIDPQQTGIPSSWRALPTFRVLPGETLSLVEKRRGDPDPGPDQLSLERTLWLDFDGRGYTVQDRIGGSMTRGWRLELAPPGELGRASVDGEDRFITRHGADGGAGVEVRRGRIDLLADSRLEEARSLLPAVGWDHDFRSVSALLHLPPGWLLVDLSGADRVSATWVKRWSLLDLFLVLIVALATGRLWGWPWGAVALAGVGLAYHEGGAPQWVWLHLLAAAALLKVLPAGRARSLVGLYRYGALLVLALVLLPFAVSQVRTGLYPQLERPWQMIGEGDVASRSRLVPAAPAPEPEMADFAETLELRAEEAPRKRMIPESKPSGVPASRPAPPLAIKELQRIDPGATIQTGPGLPQWSWQRVELGWNGPVTRGQQLRLILLPPAGNLILSLLRVALLFALVWPFLQLGGGGATWRGLLRRLPGRSAAPLVLLALLAAGGEAHADFPPPELLGELRQRLLEPAECFPACASSPRLLVETSARELRLRMEVHALAPVAVPLPGQARQWLPSRVLLDGAPARGLFRDPAGQFWIELPAGVHQVVLEGRLPEDETVLLPLPLRPRRVETRGGGWKLEGIGENGVPDGQLQLQRLEPRARAETPGLAPAALPPFVQVERTLRLGLTWEVFTRVVRLSPPGQPVSLAIPLLEGEAPTSEGVRVEKGRAMVSLPAGGMEFSWGATLSQQAPLNLKAPEGSDWTEVWRLDVSPIWHAELQGIPVVHHQDPSGNWLPEWRPWPGESVVLQISRPEGVPGRTLTVDASRLTSAPGERATDLRLELQLRSSRGGQHPLSLPEGAELQGVTIDGAAQPIRQEGRLLTLPLVPGSQRFEISWRQPDGAGALLSTPAIDLGTESVNARIDLKVPGNRWVLLTGGPAMGPAVLFWGVALVILLVSFGLGRVEMTPLRTRHWLLLGLGLSQGTVPTTLLVVGWLLALGWRRRLSAETRPELFNLAQVGLGVLTLLALLSLFYAVQQGLLGTPEMQIVGNGSHSGLLRWYQDRASGVLPSGWALTVPMMVYRLLMLAWALWLATALLRWLRWGWTAFSCTGLWRSGMVRPFPWSRRKGQTPPGK